MKVVVIGTGYVGLVSGACLAELGSTIVCLDKDEGKIRDLKSGVIPIYEPGLEEVVSRNVGHERLSFSTDLKESLKDADAVLLAVGTPTHEGKADLKYVFAAAEEVAEKLDRDIVMITKSTVPVGTGSKLAQILREKRPDLNCDVVSNPEFLREGSAVRDFLEPDRVVIGSNSDKGKELMQKLYRRLIGEGTPILFTNIPTAELIKYASNAYLATKIAFANEMADICEGVGADVELVIRGMGMDNRIGTKYMNPGPGFGGSCFPKDTVALTRIAADAGFRTQIVEAVVQANDRRKERMADKIIQASGGTVDGKNIAVLGLTFKANTDDMRYSPSLVIVPKLIEAGAVIQAYDPEGMQEAKKEFKTNKISYCSGMYEALNGADLMVILTEWDEFRKLDLSKLKASLKTGLVIDLRNILDAEDVRDAGLEYVCVGGH